MVRSCGYAVQAGFSLGHPTLVWPAEWLEPWEESPAKRGALPSGPGFHRGSGIPAPLPDGATARAQADWGTSQTFAKNERREA